MFKVYISSTETFDEIIESACESHVLCIDLNGQIFECFNRNIKQFELWIENFKNRSILDFQVWILHFLLTKN